MQQRGEQLFFLLFGFDSLWVRLALIARKWLAPLALRLIEGNGTLRMTRPAVGEKTVSSTIGNKSREIIRKNANTLK